MSKEHSFLITYGLHNFVTHDQRDGRHVFTIDKHKGQELVQHAKALIAGSYGAGADIRIA